MDAVILNAGHSQLEEQLKIAAACGVAEQGSIEHIVDVEDEGNELNVDEPNEGVHDHSMTSSCSDHDDSSPNSPPSAQRLLGDEFVKTLEQISKQQAAQLAASGVEAHVAHGGNYRTELKRPDLKGTFRCSICQKIFCHSSSLSRHRMQAHFKSYTCTLCRKEITSNETLRAHMYKQHQISRMFMCRCCNWAFPDKTSLHIHMQAKEEGKNIPVAVIGKGNPPVQSQNASSGFGALGAAPQTPTLHVPQARAPNQNPFVPLHLPTLPTHQPLSIVDPNALQAAAASLFPQMAMLRASAPGSTPADELMNKLRERLMLNSLVSQSGFGLAAWLAGLPKMDQSGMGGMGVSNADLMNPKDDSVVDMADEDDEINVDREVDEEMPAEGERQHDNNRIDITDDMAGKPDGKDLELNVHDEHHGSGDNKDSENNDRLRSSDLSAGSTTSEGSLSRPASNTMPNLRSAISASPLNSRVPKKRHLESNDTLLNIVSSERSEELPSGGENHVSPTDTHSSVSPSTECGRDCYDCSVYKGKLAVSENRCRYLEGRTATLQSDAIRFSTRASVSENSARQFDQEGRLLRDQNELLQRKLLECQEKTLAFMQGEQAVNPQAVVMYLNDILKTTFLR